jgi:hypothetical protein
MAVFETAGRGSIPRRGTEAVQYVLGVLWIARNSAKVEDQVRFLARTLWLIFKQAGAARPVARVVRPLGCWPRVFRVLGYDEGCAGSTVSSKAEHQTDNLAVAGSTPVPPRGESPDQARKRPPRCPREAGGSSVRPSCGETSNTPPRFARPGLVPVGRRVRP